MFPNCLIPVLIVYNASVFIEGGSEIANGKVVYECNQLRSWSGSKYIYVSEATVLYTPARIDARIRIATEYWLGN